MRRLSIVMAFLFLSPVAYSQTGWTKLANATTLQTNGHDVCPPNNFGGSGYNFDSLCGSGIFYAWTGFAFDPNGADGPRMISAANGGHSDYLGNEIYEFNPRTNNVTRLTAPSTTLPSTCTDPYADGRPAAGHTYGFEIVAPNTNKLYIWARITGDTNGDGCGQFKMFALDLNSVSQACAPTCTPVWTQVTPTGLPTGETIVMASGFYNYNNGKIYVFESFSAGSVGRFSVFDPIANTWTILNSLGTNTALYQQSVVDSSAQRWFVIGQTGDSNPFSGVLWCDIASGCSTINHPATDSSCTPLFSQSLPALTYDTRRQQIVGWPASGNTVYILNPTTLTCATESYGSTVGTDFPENYGNSTPMSFKFHYNEPDDNYMLCANPNTTCWTLKRPPVVRVTNTTGSTITNTPISISEAFARGDIPQFPQASINGSTVTTQADVKQRWPDGSVRFAISSFVIPSIAANAVQKVYFVNQSSGNNTGFLLKADMLGAPYNFDMQIQETGTTNNTISARAMLNATGTVLDPGTDPSGGQNGICRYWLKGAIVTAIICDDRSAARSFDFKSDTGTGNPLHPFFEIWFYAQNNNVDGIAAVENPWASSTTTNSMRDQTYALTLTGGNTAPTTLFTHASFNHIGKSRWGKHYCINGVGVGTANGCGPALAIDHTSAYEAYATALPNFDPAINLSATQLTNLGTDWTSSNRDIVETASGIGLFGLDMDVGGSSPWFGLMSDWETSYWFSRGNSGSYNSVIGNSQVVGRLPFHYREADSTVSATTLWYDKNSTVGPVGRTVSINARPQENYMTGPGNNFNDNCGGSNTLTLNLGSISDGGWNGDGMDLSHWPQLGYSAYLITGKFYYLEETQFSGAYATGADKGCPGANRVGSQGIMQASQEGRGAAWLMRSALWAWAVSVDGSPEQAYFSDKLQNYAVYRQGKYGLASTDATRATSYNRGVSDQNDPTHNPLHIGLDGANVFVESPLDTTAGHLSIGVAPWEWSYQLSVLAQARDMGFTGYDSVLAYNATQWFHLATDASFGAPYMVGTYRIPGKLVSTGTWIQNATDFKNAFTQGNGSGLATNWTDNAHTQTPCTYSPQDDHWHASPLAALGFFYPYTADGINGRVAYDTVRVSLYGSTGCMPQMYNNPVVVSGANPKWDMVARRIAATGPAPTTGFSPTSLAFGGIKLGLSSAPQSVTLTNTGSAVLNISSITLTGANPGDYTISSNACGATLGIGNNCAIGITFTPSSPIVRSASLTFSTNAASSPDNVPLSGLGTTSVVTGNGKISGNASITTHP